MRSAARFLLTHLLRRPMLAVVLGSGMGGVRLGRPSVTVPYGRVPGFPPVGVHGHDGSLELCGRVAVLRGRAHVYEGFGFEEVARPVRVMALLGVKTLVVTNAAGAVNPAYRPGDIMLIADHINLMGGNPLRGGPRFTDLAEAYDPGLRRLARRAARREGIRLREGVYAAVQGPCYETPAEVRMLRALGADAVGMSTVPEVIAAVYSGMRVLGISVISNRAAGLASGPVSHAEVLASARRALPRLQSLLQTVTVYASRSR